MPNSDNLDIPDSETLPDLPNLQTPPSPTDGPTPQPCPVDTQEVEHCVANLTLAHEIVVNTDFSFKQNNPPKDSLEGHVKEIVHQAFWDSVRAQLSLVPPDYTHAISLLQEVKDTLLSLLLPHHTRLRAHVEEVLDVTLIRQQAEHGAMDLSRLAGYVVGTMGSLCAPARDPDIQKLRGLSDPVDLLREILRVLGLMKMDMVNFTVQSLRPHLLQQAIQYERSKFQEILERQPQSLDNTTAWLKGALLEAGEDSVTPEGNSAVPISPCAVLTRAYMHLLNWDSNNQYYPETVVMDQARLEQLSQVLQRVVLEASVLLVTGSQCGGTLLTTPGVIGKLKQAICALLEGNSSRHFEHPGVLLGLAEQVLKLVDEALAAHGGTQLSPEITGTLRGQISSLTEERNPIRTLIGTRVQSYLQELLCSPTSQRDPAVPSALSLVAQELMEMGAAFKRIIHFNRLVFGPYYSSILKKLLLPERDLEVDSC